VVFNLHEGGASEIKNNNEDIYVLLNRHRIQSLRLSYLKLVGQRRLSRLSDLNLVGQRTVVAHVCPT